MASSQGKFVCRKSATADLLLWCHSQALDDVFPMDTYLRIFNQLAQRVKYVVGDAAQGRSVEVQLTYNKLLGDALDCHVTKYVQIAQAGGMKLPNVVLSFT
jgi:hypothetical protein